MFKIIYISFVLIFTPKLCQGQTGCHALFGFHQSDNILTVNFTDSTISSIPITSWLWDFGDGHSSTSHNPHHTYDHDGTYPLDNRLSIFRFCNRTALLNSLRKEPYLHNLMSFYFRKRIALIYDLGRGFIILQKEDLKFLAYDKEYARAADGVVVPEISKVEPKNGEFLRGREVSPRHVSQFLVY